MSIILGIESTAHTFGIGVVSNGEILSNIKKTYTTKKGGIIPIEAAKHHSKVKKRVYAEALNKAGISEDKIDAIAFSQGPGLAPCLIEGMKFAKELAGKLGKPIVCVNHCVAHLEIGRLIGKATHRLVHSPRTQTFKTCNPKVNPVMLYVSGANTQIIAYETGKYRIFGETLDIGVGNFIDNFGRYAGIGFPAGPKIEELALRSNAKNSQTNFSITKSHTGHTHRRRSKDSTGNYFELPYTIKGMDIALSGILTKLRNKIESKRYHLPDLAYSMQETVFAMLVETSERALAHTGKDELLLGGGVACNKRLQEMCEIMCKERGAKLFVPDNSLLVDNAAMIAYLGEIMFKKGIKEKNLKRVDIKPRERTDEVVVGWR